MASIKISVLCITYNSFPYIKTLLESILNQSIPFYEVLIYDNNSKDESVKFLEGIKDAQIFFGMENRGFCNGFNTLFKESKGDWILLINPDVRLPLDFHENLIKAIKNLSLKDVSTIAVKLYRGEGEELIPTKIIDSTGIYLNFLFRAKDRGSNEEDKGKYEKIEYVFGATGALALHKKDALKDIKLGEEVLDERFFVYREDVDLAFRLQWKGYKTIYLPFPFAYHKRFNLPERRKKIPKEINYHSLKNRFLMRFKNETLLLSLLLLPTTLIYELLIFLYCLFFERYSLKSYIYFIKNIKTSLKWRRFTLKCKRVNNLYIFSYFLWKRKRYPS